MLVSGQLGPRRRGHGFVPVWCAAVLAILRLGSDPVHEPAAQVHTDGPACGDSLAARVARSLPAGVTLADDVAIDASLARGDDGLWRIDLEIVRGEASETRSFVADDCHAVLDAAAFAIAIAVDPQRQADETARIPEPASEPSPAPEPTPDATPPPPPAASATAAIAPAPTSGPRPRRIGAYVGAAGGLDIGALPRATGWFEADLGARGEHWRAGLLGGFRLQTEQRARTDVAAGGRFWQWTVGAQACGVPTRRALEFPLCGGIEAGQLRVQGFGFVDARRLQRPWVAALLGPQLLWRVHSRAAIGIGAELGVPLLRSRIDIDGLERLHTVGPVFVRTLVRLEGRFP